MRGPSLFSSLWHRRRAGADAALALLILVVVGLMVVPLPTWLLDVLLAAHLTASVALLLVTLYVGTALEITAFPSVLLIATLVRVSLNIASTRLILLQADAGRVIRAFGDFVVRGDFVVGAVVFCILTIVQLVVITKGAERIAEVGARFSLDALPGKQMTIEAELRAGTLAVEQARERQRTLERESHFYGAMDGAMKFVRGDVLAALLILVVNLVGGVSIGVFRRGMSFTSALHTYGVLTIGDGLVTQIPALLTTTAAGILVTRVASDEAAPLGSELSAQLLAIPRALIIAGGLVALLGGVPGLPAFPFVSIGGALALVGLVRQRAGAPDARRSGAGAFQPGVVPWSLDFSADLGRRLGEGAISEFAEGLRRQVFHSRGVPLPPCSARVDAQLPNRHVVLSLHEVPASVVQVPAEHEDALAEVEKPVLPLLLSRAADFLGISETQRLLSQLEDQAPGTLRHVVPRIVDVSGLTDVLRRLVEEGVSVRDLKGILDALARAPEGHREPLALTELVRAELRRSLTWDLTGGAPEIAVVVLDSHIEEAVRSAVSRTTAGAFLTLAPGAARDIVAAVRRAFDGSGTPAERGGVVLTRPDVRRFVRKVLETDLPQVRVVSHAELLPDLIVKTRARATVSSA